MSSRGISTTRGLDKQFIITGAVFLLWAFLRFRPFGVCLGGLFDFGCIQKRGIMVKVKLDLKAVALVGTFQEIYWRRGWVTN